MWRRKRGALQIEHFRCENAESSGEDWEKRQRAFSQFFPLNSCRLMQKQRIEREKLGKMAAIHFPVFPAQFVFASAKTPNQAGKHGKKLRVFPNLSGSICAFPCESAKSSGKTWKK